MIYKSLRHACTFILVSLAAFTSVVTEQASAESAYPARPIKVIVPFGPGSGVDAVIQAIKPEIESQLGVPVVVVHKAGAGGQVGTQAIVDSLPDGYTIGMSTVSTVATNFVFKKQTYTHSDLEFISRIGFMPRALATNLQFPAQTYAQFVDQVKKSKDPYFYTTVINTVDMLDMELIKKHSSLTLTAVPYPDSGASFKTDFASNRIQITYNSLPVITSLIAGTNAKLLAITGNRRHPAWPAVPSFAELGIKELNRASFYGFVAPANTSQLYINTLNRALVAALMMPSAVEKLNRLGIISAPSTPLEHKLESQETLKLYLETAADLKIQPQ